MIPEAKPDTATATSAYSIGCMDPKPLFWQHVGAVFTFRAIEERRGKA